MTRQRWPQRFSVAMGTGAMLVGLLGATVTSSLSAAQRADAPPKPPLGLPPIPFPDENPYSKQKAELGKLLYFDPRLSTSQEISCASCHDPGKGFTDQQPVSTGIGGQKGGRSAPTVVNRAYSQRQFWDGRAPTLEEQAKGPLANPIEMTSHKTGDAAHKACVDCLAGIPGYRRLFKQVFRTDQITIDQVAQAIATFERTVVSGNSPYDRYQAGDKQALNEQQVRGMGLFFGKANCEQCHIGFNFTDNAFVNIGVGMDGPNPDLGRFAISKKEDDRGAFKTPTLREVAQSGPYMHDGSLKTLEDVVEFYNKGGVKNQWQSERIKPLNLTDQEKKDLVAFLRALNGEGWQHALEKPKTLPQ
jgi:cytochrome c peroxidase